VKRLALLLGFVVLSTVSAKAATIGLTPAEADNLLLLSATGAPTFVDTGVRTYTVAWNGTVNGLNTANIGVNFGSPRGVAGDTFVVNVTNDDENAWEFAVSLNGVATPFVLIPSNGTQMFSVAVTAPVSQFALILRGNLPMMGDDRTAEFRVDAVAPVPELSAVMLLGSGLLGVAGYARKRLRSK
jgi:hypothetical protein